MVLSVRSQSPQFTELSILQSGLFKICHDTRCGMDRFFSFRFEIILYGKNQNQKSQNLIQLSWRLTGTGNHLEMMRIMLFCNPSMDAFRGGHYY
jgi:hypothetical protein